MKCQYCEKPATFHITELTEPGGPQVMHLCEEHARGFLQKEAATPAASIAGALAKQLDLGQTKQELAEGAKVKGRNKDKGRAGARRGR